MTKTDETMHPDLMMKTGMLVEALPFMRRYSGKTILVKFGGNAMGKADFVAAFASDIALLDQVGARPVVVHGGGPQIGAMLDKLKIDDPVGAISVHGVVGLLGLLLVPLTNDGASFSGQIIGALTIFGWVFAASLVVFFVIKLVMGLRVSDEEEYEGSDLSECGMEAYPEFAAKR